MASQTATVTATDPYGNTDTSYAGNKNITFSGASSSTNPVTAPTFRDRNAVDQNFGSATSLTFTTGVASGLMKLYKAESPLVSATDGTISSAAGDRLSVTVNPAAATRLVVTGSASQTAGAAQALTITATDPYGNTDTSYTGAHSLTFSGASSSTNPVTAPTVTNNAAAAIAFGSATSITFTNGVCTTRRLDEALQGRERRRLDHRRQHQLRRRRPALGHRQPGRRASRLVVTGSASQTAGGSQTATVTATDPYGNTDTSYAGNKNITFSGANSSPNPVTAPTFRDRNAVDQNFGSATSLTFTSGVASGLMKLYKAESAVIVASDGTISSTGADRLSVTVNPAAAATLQVTAGTPQTAGTSFSAVVTAKDAFGNTATGYTGTVHFTSTDPAPTLPGDYTFVAGDSGSQTFSVTLNTTGSRTMTATDTVTGSITGTSSAITVNAGAASTATSTISAAPGSITADGSTTSTVTVQLKDALGNNLTSSGGTVALAPPSARSARSPTTRTAPTTRR